LADRSHALRPLAETINQECVMGINKDQVEGRAREAGGKIQEEFGKLTDNKTQEVKGAINKTVGAGRAKLGDVAEKIKDPNRKT
jgi:uncharacterized protein YjbJ (UPF0337 family)